MWKENEQSQLAQWTVTNFTTKENHGVYILCAYHPLKNTNLGAVFSIQKTSNLKHTKQQKGPLQLFNRHLQQLMKDKRDTISGNPYITKSCET